MRGTPVRYVDFRGGVNRQASPYLVAANECQDCRNVVSTTRGAIRKRNGNTLFKSAGALIERIFPYIESGRSLLLLKQTSSNSILALEANATSTTITSAHAIEQIIQAPTSGGQGPVYGSSLGTPKQWNASLATTSFSDWTASSGTVPAAAFCLYFKNRVWMAKSTANPNRLFFSGLGDPRVWPAANVVDLDPNDGDQITGLGTIGPYLLVFKTTKCYVIYDLDTGANRMLSTNVGCVAPRTIVETPHGTFFLSNQGVFLTDGTSLRKVSDNVDSLLEAFNPQFRYVIAGGFYGNHYYLSYQERSGGLVSAGYTLDYDTDLSSWWIHSNTVTDFAVWLPISSSFVFEEAFLYAGGAGNIGEAPSLVERCYVPNTWQDRGSNYTAYWKGPWLAFNEPYRRKRLRSVRVDSRGDYSMKLSVDFSTTETTWKTVSGSSSTIVDEQRLLTPGVAQAFSLKLEATHNTDWEVDGVTYLVTPRAD